jgi:hypothetical protein
MLPVHHMHQQRGTRCRLDSARVGERLQRVHTGGDNSITEMGLSPPQASGIGLQTLGTFPSFRCLTGVVTRHSVLEKVHDLR